MFKTFLISLGAVFLSAVGASRAAACEDGLQAVLADGKLLELEDGVSGKYIQQIGLQHPLGWRPPT